MLFLFKFFSFVFFFFGLLCSSFFLSQHTFTQNRKRCQTSLVKSFSLSSPLGIFVILILWLSLDLLFYIFVLSSFFLLVSSFSFFAKNQMHLTLKIIAQ